MRGAVCAVALCAAPLAAQERCRVDTLAHMVEVPITIGVEGAIGDAADPVPQLTRALGDILRRRFTPPPTVGAMVPVGRIHQAMSPRPPGRLLTVVHLTLAADGRVTHARWMQPARDSLTGVALLDALRAAGRAGELAYLLPVLAGTTLGVRIVEMNATSDPVVTVRQRVLKVERMPEYLSGPSAGRTGLQGQVLVAFTVTDAGRVDSASVRVLRSTEPRLDEAAMRMARGAKYRAARIGDCPVAMEVVQQYRFDADRSIGEGGRP